MSRFCSKAYEGIQKSQSESSSSSGAQDCDHPIDLFVLDLLDAARKRVFIPPRGSHMDDCWTRINVVIESAVRGDETYRFGDILLFSNTLLTNDRLKSVSPIELLEMIQSRIHQRSRLPNVFTLIQYLRFLVSTGAKPVSVSALSLTVQLAHQIKVSELIEIASLITRSKWIHGSSKNDVIDLLSILADRISSADDVNAYSDRNHKNGEQLVSYFFNEFFDAADMNTPELRDAWLRLMVIVMADRHCASVGVLDKMIEIGLSLWETGYQDEARFIATAIRDHQLSRAFIIKSFLRDETRMRKLSALSNLTKVNLSFHRDADMIRFGPTSSDSSKGLTGLYRRVLPDINGAPQYRKGRFFLYHSSSSSCWQISTDVTRDFGRIAFISGSAAEIPFGKQGWQVFSRSKYSFVDCSYDVARFNPGDELSLTSSKDHIPVRSAPIGLTSGDSEPEDDREPQTAPKAGELVESFLNEWSAIEDVQKDAENPAGNRLVELERMVTELEEKVSFLEASIECRSVTVSGPATPSITQTELGNSGLMRAIGSRLADMIRPELTQVNVPRSFEAAREEDLRLDRLASKSRIISRKLRSPS